MACEYYRNNIKSNDGTSIFGSGKLSLSLLSFFLSTFFCAKMEIICARRIPPGSRSTEVPTAEEEEIKSCEMRSRTIKNLWPNGRDEESTLALQIFAARIPIRSKERWRNPDFDLAASSWECFRQSTWLARTANIRLHGQRSSRCFLFILLWAY